MDCYVVHSSDITGSGVSVIQLAAGESSRGWLESLGTCTLVGDLQEAPASESTQLWTLGPFGE